VQTRGRDLSTRLRGRVRYCGGSGPLVLPYPAERQPNSPPGAGILDQPQRTTRGHPDPCRGARRAHRDRPELLPGRRDRPRSQDPGGASRRPDPGFRLRGLRHARQHPHWVLWARGLSSHPRSARGDGDHDPATTERSPHPVTRPAASLRTCGTCSPSRPVPPDQRPARRRPGNEAGRAPHVRITITRCEASSTTPRR
jgi:hypothetical protein